MDYFSLNVGLVQRDDDDVTLESKSSAKKAKISPVQHDFVESSHNEKKQGSEMDAMHNAQVCNSPSKQSWVEDSGMCWRDLLVEELSACAATWPIGAADITNSGDGKEMSASNEVRLP